MIKKVTLVVLFCVGIVAGYTVAFDRFIHYIDNLPEKWLPEDEEWDL
jgi:hypothetical protein